MAKRTPTKKKKTAPPGNQHGVKLALAGLFLVGFLVVSLVVLSSLKQSFQPTEPVQPLPVTPPATAVVDRAALLQDIQVELESAMLRSGASLERLQAKEINGVRQLEVDGLFPNEQILKELSQRLHRLAPDLELLASLPQNSLVLQQGSRPLFRLLFSPERYTPSRSGGPWVAIIMDDLGRDLSVAKQAIAIDYPITLAILPNVRHAAEVATLAHRRNREVMVHIPMEPLSYPKANPGDNALLVNLQPDEIRRRFLSYLDKIPYAVGGNNHMGSRFTTYEAGMQTVLELMKEEGLFFIDSRTTGGTIGLEEAEKLHLPAAARDIFLDNDADVERISRQIRKLVVLAGKKGSAIGICHPYPQTIAALRQELPQLRAAGVTMVPASQLVSR